MKAKPPGVAAWLLRQFGAGPHFESMLGDMAERYEQDQSKAWYWKQTATVLIVGMRRIPMKRAAIWGLALVSMFLVGFWIGRIPSRHIEQVAKVERVPDTPTNNEAPAQATAEPKPTKQKGAVKIFVVNPSEQEHLNGAVVDMTPIKRQIARNDMELLVQRQLNDLQSVLSEAIEINEQKSSVESNARVEALRAELRDLQLQIEIWRQRDPKP